jgi:hypothetical protein
MRKEEMQFPQVPTKRALQPLCQSPPGAHQWPPRGVAGSGRCQAPPEPL